MDIRLTDGRIPITSVSLDELVLCPQCQRLFKGRKGLGIHLGKSHKHVQVPSSFLTKIGFLKTNFSIIRRIPRGARISVAQSLSNTISTNTIHQNSFDSWEKLLTFSYTILHINKDKYTRGSLTQKIKNNCINIPTPNQFHQHPNNHYHNNSNICI